jgi:hypothetical protein
MPLASARTQKPSEIQSDDMTSTEIAAVLVPDTVLRHLNQRDLADRWRMSGRTLERWRLLRQGPPFLKLGGRVVYRIEDIEAFEAAQLEATSTVCATTSRSRGNHPTPNP